MSQRIIDWKSGVATTVGAVSASICDTSTIPDGANCTLEIFLQGRETTTGEQASYSAVQGAKRIGGVLSLVGAPVATVSMAAGSDAGLATASPALSVVSNAIRLSVTGVAAKTIEWFGDVRPRVN